MQTNIIANTTIILAQLARLLGRYVSMQVRI